MNFLKSVAMPNGLTLGYHKIVKVEISPPANSIIIQVASWSDEATYMAGVPAAWNAYEQRTLDGSLTTAFENMLVSSGAFEGALPTPDLAGTLADVKAKKWAAVKARRSNVEFGPVEYDGHGYDADPDAQRRIVGGVSISVIQQLQWCMTSIRLLSQGSTALPNEPGFSMPWTDVDNEAVTLDATGMQGLGLAVAAQVGMAHAVSRAVYAQLESSATDTIEKVQAIPDWQI